MQARRAKLAAYSPSPKALKSLLLLLHLKTPHYMRIPLSLLREICEFIGRSRLLPGIEGNVMKLYDLDTGEVRVKSLPVRFTIGTVFILLNSTNSLGIGGSPANARAYFLNLFSGFVQNARKMTAERAFPGAVLYGKAVYVFGGKRLVALQSCERFTVAGKRWKPLPDMHSAKYGFNPCVYQEEIYLIGVGKELVQAEVFSPVYLQFRLLSFTLKETHIGTISLVDSDTFCILLGSRRLARGKMQGELEAEVAEMWVEDRGCVVSSAGPVRVGWGCYWTHCVTGELVGFDWRSGRVMEGN